MNGLCQWKGCDRQGVVAVAVNVPALGCPLAEHDPIKMVLSLPLCDEHFNSARPEDFIGPELRQVVMIQLRRQNLALPDYDRAFLTRVSFESEEWMQLQKAWAK